MEFFIWGCLSLATCTKGVLCFFFIVPVMCHLLSTPTVLPDVNNRHTACVIIVFPWQIPMTVFHHSSIAFAPSFHACTFCQSGSAGWSHSLNCARSYMYTRRRLTYSFSPGIKHGWWWLSVRCLWLLFETVRIHLVVKWSTLWFEIRMLAADSLQNSTRIQLFASEYEKYTNRTPRYSEAETSRECENWSNVPT